MRSASPSFWVRSTTPSSRYRLTGAFSPCRGAVGWPPHPASPSRSYRDHRSARTDLLHRIERYLRRRPPRSADAEQVGPFTLFVAAGRLAVLRPSRPGVGPRPVTADDVDRAASPAARARRWPRTSSGSPRSHRTSPPPAATPACTVAEHPLLVHHDPLAVPVPDGIRIRRLGADDEAVAAAQVVAHARLRQPAALRSEPPAPAERDAALRGHAAPRRPTTCASLIARRPVRVRGGRGRARGARARAAHNPVGDVTEIVGVATLPSARRRGLGAAVTDTLVADALRRGVAGHLPVGRRRGRRPRLRAGRLHAGSAPPGGRAPDSGVAGDFRDPESHRGSGTGVTAWGPAARLTALSDRLERGGDDVGVDADAPEDLAADGALDVGRGLRVAAGSSSRARRSRARARRTRCSASASDERRDRAVAVALELAPLAVDVQADRAARPSPRTPRTCARRSAAAGRVGARYSRLEDRPHLARGMTSPPSSSVCCWMTRLNSICSRRGRSSWCSAFMM